jgi:hypothetical protein
MERWQQAEGRRHILATDCAPQVIEPGKTFLTLCGKHVTPARADIIELGGLWFDGTCMVCEAAWFAADAAKGGKR